MCVGGAGVSPAGCESEERRAQGADPAEGNGATEHRAPQRPLKAGAHGVGRRGGYGYWAKRQATEERLDQQIVTIIPPEPTYRLGCKGFTIKP